MNKPDLGNTSGASDMYRLAEEMCRKGDLMEGTNDNGGASEVPGTCEIA
jgi:hypothetical protein